MTDGWEGILDQDERILWQGRPDGGIVLGAANMSTVVFGLIFTAFSVHWMYNAAQSGDAFWMFGLLHFSAGLAFALGPILGGAYIRRHTWYTLTDQRAIVAKDLPLKGRTLNSYRIFGDTHISFEEGGLSTIHFAEETRYDEGSKTTSPIGFERIPDGREVYRLIRDIQKAQLEGA